MAEGRKSDLIFENVIFFSNQYVACCSLIVGPANLGLCLHKTTHLHLKEHEILRKIIYCTQYGTNGLHTRLLHRYVCCV